MILVGVNVGLGAKDCADLNWRHLNLSEGIIDYARGKTGIERRAMLWPETVTALKQVRDAKRPTPKDPADADAVFLTRCGQRWVREQVPGTLAEGRQTKRSVTIVDSVGLLFNKLLVKLGHKQEGIGFYSLRHVCETIGGGTGDQAAVDRIMGHERGTMDEIYRVWRRDDEENKRLRKVADHVHGWLFGRNGKAAARRIVPRKSKTTSRRRTQ
jgi:integrase